MRAYPSMINLKVRQIIDLLVTGNYKELENLSNGERLSAENIDAAIQDYGDVLVMPPDEAFNYLDVIEVENKPWRQWAITFDLWTQSESPSDLSLEMTLVDSDEGGLRVEIDNIHVL